MSTSRNAVSTTIFISDLEQDHILSSSHPKTSFCCPSMFTDFFLFVTDSATPGWQLHATENSAQSVCRNFAKGFPKGCQHIGITAKGKMSTDSSRSSTSQCPGCICFQYLDLIKFGFYNLPAFSFLESKESPNNRIYRCLNKYISTELT